MSLKQMLWQSIKVSLLINLLFAVGILISGCIFSNNEDLVFSRYYNLNEKEEAKKKDKLPRIATNKPIKVAIIGEDGKPKITKKDLGGMIPVPEPEFKALICEEESTVRDK